MTSTSLRRTIPLTGVLPLLLLGMAFQAGAASATATANAQGTLHFEFVDVQDGMGNSIPGFPKGFSLTLGPPVVNQSPDAANNGNGMVTFGGSSTAMGSGQASVIDLASNIQCTSDPQGSYGGFEDAFNTAITVANTSGQTVVLILRFDSSYTLATSTTVAGETAEASIDINWPAPQGTTAALTNCPLGSISGSTLLLGQANVSAGAGASQALSSCEVALTVPTGITSSGGLAADLAQCEATSPAMAPALPAAAAAALLALLTLAGWWMLRGRQLSVPAE